LCESVDAIFDLAADTRLFGQSDSFQKANVAAVRNAITMCATGRAKDLHYVSTLAVSGVNLSASPVQFSEADLDIGQEFRNEYERSKFIAEQWVHEFMDSGGTGFIYRAGHVSADSCTGKFRQDFGHNRMVQILRAIIKIGKLPARLDMVQALSAVDEVASGIFELARAAQAFPGTYHVDGGNEITYRDIITQLQELGYSFEASDYDTFADLFESHSRTGDPDIALGYFWSRRRPRNLKLDCSRTLELLRPMGVVFTPFDAVLLHRFLSQLVRVGAFDFDISPAIQRKETGN
jgi:thioester reductase-like protein